MTDDSHRPESDPSTPSTRPEAVRLEKGSLGEGVLGGAPDTHQTQAGGSSPWADAQAIASGPGRVAPNSSGGDVSAFQMHTGAADTPVQGGAMQGGAVQGDVAQKKLVAGLLGIFLGSLGVHKFYLGMNQPGIIMLVCTLAGYLLFTLLAIILIGFVFLLVPAAVGLIGLIEGILYLTKSDTDFQRDYLVGKRLWF